MSYEICDSTKVIMQNYSIAFIRSHFHVTSNLGHALVFNASRRFGREEDCFPSIMGRHIREKRTKGFEVAMHLAFQFSILFGG